jgi:flagellar basal-body rod modification protein FlgD
MINPISSVLPNFLASVAASNPLPGTANAGAAPSTSAGGSGTAAKVGGLDSSSFLKLLVAQISNQDPMKPTDSATYITEEAQFSMVQSMNTMSSQNTAILNSQLMQQATSFIGKTVTFTMGDGTTAGGVVSSASPGDNGATVRVGSLQIPLSSISSVFDPNIVAGANAATNVPSATPAPTP